MQPSIHRLLLFYSGFMRSVNLISVHRCTSELINGQRDQREGIQIFYGDFIQSAITYTGPSLPSFFSTKNKLVEAGDVEQLMNPSRSTSDTYSSIALVLVKERGWKCDRGGGSWQEVNSAMEW